MSTRGTFNTTLVWYEGEDEFEADVRVLYSRTNGYAATLEEPGCDAEIEIIDIAPSDKSITVPEAFYEDEDLIAECFEDWWNEEEEAAEWRAQSRRDQLMGGF